MAQKITDNMEQLEKPAPKQRKIVYAYDEPVSTDSTPKGWKAAAIPAVRAFGSTAGAIGGAALGTVVAPGPGTVAGEVGGGMAGGAIAELIAEWLEGKGYNPARVGVEAALGAVPVSKLAKAGKVVASAGKGAVLAQAGNIGRRYAETGDTSLYKDGDASSMFMGAATGGITSKVMHAAGPKGSGHDPSVKGYEPMPVDLGKVPGPAGDRVGMPTKQDIITRAKSVHELAPAIEGPQLPGKGGEYAGPIPREHANPPMTKLEHGIAEKELALEAKPGTVEKPLTGVVKGIKEGDKVFQAHTKEQTAQQGKNAQATEKFERSVTDETARQNARLASKAERKAASDARRLAADQKIAEIKARAQKKLEDEAAAKLKVDAAIADGSLQRKTPVLKETTKKTEGGTTTTMSVPLKPPKKADVPIVPGTPKAPKVPQGPPLTPAQKFQAKIDQILVSIGEKPSASVPKASPTVSPEPPAGAPAPKPKGPKGSKTAPAAAKPVPTATPASKAALPTSKEVGLTAESMSPGEADRVVKQWDEKRAVPRTQDELTASVDKIFADRRAGVAGAASAPATATATGVPKAFEPFVTPEGAKPAPGAGGKPSRVAELEQHLQGLPADHPAVPAIKAELAAGAKYQALQAKAQGAPKGSPERAAARVAGAEAAMAREATNAALGGSGGPSKGSVASTRGATPVMQAPGTVQAPIPVTPAGQAQTSKARETALAKRKAVDAGVVTDHTSGAQSDLDAIEKMTPEKRKAYVDKMKRGEEGAIDPALLVKMGMTGAGALTGAAVNKEDPFTGALMGGAAGFGAAHGGERAIQYLMKNPDAAKQLEEGATAIGRRLPNLQRANYLASVNLPANSIGGPMGSGVMGSLEHILQGAISGDKGMVNMYTNVLKELANPVKMTGRFRTGYEEAAGLINRAESEGISRAELQAMMSDNKILKQIDKWSSIPGQAMVAGDTAIRNVLKAHGVPDDVARRITLTNEAAGTSLKKLQDLGKTGADEGKAILLGLMFPFRRTTANILEQGLERTPGVGIAYQYLAKRGKNAALRDSPAAMASQQILGGTVFYGAKKLGESITPETAKEYRQWVSNLGGQYSLLASAGLAAGQASRAGKGGAGVLKAAVTNAVQNTPVPSTRVITDNYASGSKLIEALANRDTSQLKLPDDLPPGTYPNLFNKEGRENVGSWINWLTNQKP